MASSKPKFTVYHISSRGGAMVKIAECETRRETLAHRIFTKTSEAAKSGMRSVVYDINGNFIGTP